MISPAHPLPHRDDDLHHGVVIRGVTAFPLLTELRILSRIFGPVDSKALAFWIETFHNGLEVTYARGWISADFSLLIPCASTGF